MLKELRNAAAVGVITLASFFVPLLSAPVRARFAVPAVISEVSIKANDKDYALKLLPGKDAVVDKGELPCGSQNEESLILSCTADLVLQSGDQALFRISLSTQQYETSGNRWKIKYEEPLRLLDRHGAPPLIVLPQYGSCNGIYYAFFWLRATSTAIEIKPVEFDFHCGGPANTLFGWDARMSFNDKARQSVLWVEGYDNATELNCISQYVESWKAGRWVCIGHYSSIAGSYETGKKLMNEALDSMKPGTRKSP